MKRQKTFSLLQLLIEVVITLFIAGIVVPSLLRSDVATKEALAVGSLRTINIAGITFSYMNQNVEFAILGAVVGAMAAFAIDFLATKPKNTTSTRTTICGPRQCDTETVLGHVEQWGFVCRENLPFGGENMSA